MEWSEAQRQRAHALAQAMAGNVDANEVGKVLAFWRRWRDPHKVFLLLQRLPRSGLVRTGRTRGYYQAMARAFEQHLRGLDSESFGAVLGWAFRLMRYYELGPTPARRRQRRPR